MEALLLIPALALMIFLVELWLRWEDRRGSFNQTAPDNVVRRNVRRRCRSCGSPVTVDVFTVNPTCITCQDEARD